MSESMDSPALSAAWLRLLRRGAPGVLTLLALALAGQGQGIFNVQQPATIRAGMLRFLLAALCLLVARLLLRPSTLPESHPLSPVIRATQLPVWRSLGPWRVAATGVGLLLTGSLLALLARLDPTLPGPYGLFLGLWLASLALVGAAWLLPGTPWPRLRARATGALRAHRGELVALGAIVGLGAWLRLADLGGAPFTASGDEGSIGMEALALLRGSPRNPFAFGWGAIPTLSSFAIAALMRLFGPSLMTVRLFGALGGILALPALWALARAMAGRGAALTAALLLATFPLHIHYSRVAEGVAWESFFVPASLAALWWGVRHPAGALRFWALAGLLAGMGQYASFNLRWLPLLLIGALFLLTTPDRSGMRSRWPGLAVLVLLFVVTASPLYLHYLRFPADAHARLLHPTILQTTWLDSEAAARGEGALALLWDQARRSLFGFAFFPDQSAAWGARGPLAPPLLSLPLFLGLIVSLRRWRDPAIATLHLWFWGGLVVGGVLLLGTPLSHSLLALAPVAALLAALGWQGMARALTPLAPPERQRPARALLLALLAGSTALLGVQAHRTYLATNEFGGANARIATMAASTAAALPPGSTLVLLGAPRLYADGPPLPFLLPARGRLDLIEPLAAPPTGLPAAGDLLFVVLPERAAEIFFIQQSFPDATPREVRHPVGGELLFYELHIPRR